jgi:UDP-N-acetyl-D-glucosamine dehydrogenase
MPESKVAVIGQGYVGLPLAVAAAEAGLDVVGVDLVEARIDVLNRGESPVGDVSDERLRSVLDAGRYRATSDWSVVGAVDVVVICVPTPYHDDEPDLSYVESAAAALAPHLVDGALVILESTTYPGTTEELLIPILEAGSNLKVGEQLHVAFSPERIDPGNERFGLRNTPKIIGGVTDEATERAAAFYGAFVDNVHRVSGPKAAEMAKLLENTFRHINIALVNELAVLADGLDVDIWEVIDAAATKPFGFMPFYPGPGVGGHCIPVDPMYLSWRVRQFGGAAKFIELARDVNNAMPVYCVGRVQDLLNDRAKPLRGASVLVLGVAYKADISDMRESPALPLVEALVEKGADVSYHDPHVPHLVVGDLALQSVELSDDRLAVTDCVLIVTAHGDVDHERVAALAPLVFDTRRAIAGRRDNVVTL